MQTGDALERVLRPGLQAGAVALAYFATGKIGLALAAANPSVTAIWPPTGIAIAGMLLFGYRAVPAVMIAAFLVNVTTTHVASSSVLIAAGNTLEAVAVCALVRRYAGGVRVFENVPSTLLFGPFAGISAVISASIGIGTLYAYGLAQPTDLTIMWMNWWLGDFAGALVFTPIIFFWNAPQDESLPGGIGELILMLASLTLTIAIVFNGLLPILPPNLPLVFLQVPFLFWSALRFGRKITLLAGCLVAFMAIAGTIRGYGPFAGFPLEQSLAIQQAFAAVTIFTNFCLAASIRAHRKLESRISGSEQRFRALFEHMWDMIALLDMEGNFLSVSPSITRILGYKETELIGENTFSFLHPDDVARVRSIFDDLVSEPGGTRSAQYRFRAKDGSWFWLEGHSTNLLELPAVQAVVVNVRDITDRKREEIVQTRFLTLAAHQLRTPLTTMRWTVESLRKSGSGMDPWHRENLEIARKSVLRMSDAVRSMLTVAQLESGRVQITKSSVRVSEFLRDLRAEFVDSCGKKHQTVVLRCDEDETVETDPDLLRHILENLLTNASAYSPPHSVIYVVARRVNDRVWIDVADQGPGIPGSHKDRIFTLFFRGSNTSAQEGTGLGLYLAHTIAAVIGGQLTFTSEEGKGTVFRLSLPASEVRASEAEGIAESMSPELSAPSRSIDSYAGTPSS